ncbi:MAG: c-type cytochrome, partial [Opitutaceae bacterium]
TITVRTSRGADTLECQISIPVVLGKQREQNIKLAQADRQAVFKGECASCHVEPAKGKSGMALYATACAICHEGEHRASMVPDLSETAGLRGGDPAYWETWIRQGKEGTLMPAFARAAGGPLEEAQIRSLVEGLTARLRNGRWPEQEPARPRAVQSVVAPPDALPQSTSAQAAETRLK